MKRIEPNHPMQPSGWAIIYLVAADLLAAIGVGAGLWYWITRLQW